MSLLIDVQVNQPRLEVELLGGSIADRVLEAVAAHVPALVFLGPEGEEGVLVRPIDRRAGQAKEESLRQARRASSVRGRLPGCGGLRRRAR